LPPFSTILGWVHWVIRAEEPLPMNVGVVGSFDSITYDLQTLIKFDRLRREKDQIVLEGFNKALSSSPTYVANITDIHLRIYLQMDFQYLEAFRNKVMLRNYPSLGRYEDLIRVDEVNYISPERQQISNLNRPISINYGAYLTPETAKRSGNQGSIIQLPFYHDLIEGKRFFKKEKAIFLDTGDFRSGEYFFDQEVDESFSSPVIIDLFGKYQTVTE